MKSPRMRRWRPTPSSAAVAMSATALLIAATGVSPAEAAKAVKRALSAANADKVGGIQASRKPEANKLVPLGPDAKLPASVVPSGFRGPRGAQGPAGEVGAAGASGAAAGPGGQPVVFRARAVAQQTVNNTQQRVLFGGEDFDPTDAFDPASSQFKAPVSGYYSFSTTIEMDVAVGDQRVVPMLLSSRANMGVRGTDFSTAGYQQGIATGIMKLERGDSVETAIYAGNVRTVQASGLTLFSGHLIAPS